VAPFYSFYRFLCSDDVSLQLFVNATSDPALLSQIINKCNLSNRETTVLMLWLSRYRELGWPHALASGLEKHPGYLDEGTTARQKVARKLHGLPDRKTSEGSDSSNDDAVDGDVPCVAMLPASYTLALVPNWRQVVAQQQRQQQATTQSGGSATPGAAVAVTPGSLAACFGTCIFPCPDPVEVMMVMCLSVAWPFFFFFLFLKTFRGL